MRLNAFLARAGVASRRRADELISAGRVRVNGDVGQLNTVVGPRDVVAVDGQPVVRQRLAYVLLHKPAGVLTTASDPRGRATVVGLVAHEARVVPVGRLDADTTGALLLDDEVIHHHWFLALRSRNGSIPVVVPRQGNVQGTVTMSTVGQETLQIGNHDLAATHLRATMSGGQVHDLWVDGSGRLLKVALPAKGLVAVRDDPPPA